MSREEAIEILSDMRAEYNLFGDEKEATRYHVLSWAIQDMKRKIGHWIDDCACSVCHWIHEDDEGFALLTNYPFCPNCGAYMRGEEG